MKSDSQPENDRTTTGITDAAQRLGLTTDAIRKRLARGTLEGFKGPDGWRVFLDVQPDSDKLQTGLDQKLIEVLQAQVQEQQEQLRERGQEIQQLHILLQQNQAALPFPGQQKWWQFWK